MNTDRHCQAKTGRVERANEVACLPGLILRAKLKTILSKNSVINHCSRASSFKFANLFGISKLEVLVTKIKSTMTYRPGRSDNLGKILIKCIESPVS